MFLSGTGCGGDCGVKWRTVTSSEKYWTRMLLFSNRRGMALEVFLSPGARPSAVDGVEVRSATTRSAGARAFDLCSPEIAEGDGGRRSLKPIQKAITNTSTPATPTAVTPRHTFNGMSFARFDATQAERVSAGVSNCVGRA
jgi:hypothetical protein